ncbi:MAG: hypothetical protein PHG55_05020, partial [Verrucomicrobiota bacterium]|nr:hypothetical protein [Verrucomicrobiota bacterium]
GLKHHMGMAGSPNLMTLEMIDLLCEQRNGNFRTLMVSANRLLDCAMRKEINHIFRPGFTSRAWAALCRSNAGEQGGLLNLG